MVVLGARYSGAMQERRLSRADLLANVARFVDAFNRDDLDEAMTYFAGDAIYEEFGGTRHEGKAAIRIAFEPQFRGDFGTLRFETEDCFADEIAESALVRWRCVIGGKSGWRGLDVIRFQGGLVKEKLTYAKTKMPLVERDLSLRA